MIYLLNLNYKKNHKIKEEMKFFTLVAGFLLLSQTEQARILTGSQLLIMPTNLTLNLEPPNPISQSINIQSDYKVIDTDKNII